MRIGVSTACLYPMETEKAAALLIESGFSVLEVFFNSFSELESEYLKRLSEYVSSKGCEIVSVHPFLSGIEPFLFFSNYERRFRDSVDFYEKFFGAAEILGAKKLVLHGGVFPDKYGLSDEEYCRRFEILAERGRSFGVDVLHENVNKFRASSPDFIKAMRRLIPESAKFTLDIKQAVRAGQDPFLLLNAMGASLEHIHINDHNGENDCLLPGFGSFDYRELFSRCRELGYDGDVIIEVYRKSFGDISELRESALRLSKLREL